MITLTYDQIYYERKDVEVDNVRAWLKVTALSPTNGMGLRIPFIQLELWIDEENSRPVADWHQPSNIALIPCIWENDSEVIRKAIRLLDNTAAMIKRHGWPNYLSEAMEQAGY